MTALDNMVKDKLVTPGQSPAVVRALFCTMTMALAPFEDTDSPEPPEKQLSVREPSERVQCSESVAAHACRLLGVVEKLLTDEASCGNVRVHLQQFLGSKLANTDATFQRSMVRMLISLSAPSTSVAALVSCQSHS